MTAPGLRARLGRLFIAQIAIIGIATVVGIYLTELVVEDMLTRRALTLEAERFSAEKHRLTRSPYRHLLPPRPGGFTAIYDSLAHTGALVVDLTLDYEGDVTFWRFLGGAANVSATATVWDWDELAECDRSAWLRQRWQIKDRQLAREAAEPA